MKATGSPTPEAGSARATTMSLRVENPPMASLSVGDQAPDFTLEGTEGPFTLSEQRGKRVVLLFYPHDNSPVCTKQFCSYRDREADMSSLDAVVVGVSGGD